MLSKLKHLNLVKECPTFTCITKVLEPALKTCSPISINALLPVKTSPQSTKNSSHSSIPRTNYTPLKNSSTPLHSPIPLAPNTTLTTNPIPIPTSMINDPSQYKINTIGKKMGKISAWYDNEWGFSCRMCDLAEYIHKKI